MVGTPGSGKSTKAEQIAKDHNAIIVSGDDIRSQLYGSAEIQGNWVEIHDEIENQVTAAAEKNRPVILDGTHYRSSFRKEAIELLRSYGYEWVEAIVMNTTLATCLARNFKRERNVPDYVVKTMYEKLQSSLKYIPDENFDQVHFIN